MKKQKFNTKFDGLTWSDFIKGASADSQNMGYPTTQLGKKVLKALNETNVNRRVGESYMGYLSRVWKAEPYQTY